METKISCKINNLIENYCQNFLSYLYSNDGWQRTMFDLGKEVFIPSSIDKKEIRILISNTGSVLITCRYVTDIMTSIDFIISQFNQNRMSSYISEDIKIKLEFETKIGLNFEIEERNYFYNIGSIHFSENLATIKYSEYKNRDELILKIYMIWENEFLSHENDEIEADIFDEELEDEDFNSEDYLNYTDRRININKEYFLEFFLFSSFGFITALKLVELL